VSNENIGDKFYEYVCYGKCEGCGVGFYDLRTNNRQPEPNAGLCEYCEKELKDGK